MTRVLLGKCAPHSGTKEKGKLTSYRYGKQLRQAAIFATHPKSMQYGRHMIQPRCSPCLACAATRAVPRLMKYINYERLRCVLSVCDTCTLALTPLRRGSILLMPRKFLSLPVNCFSKPCLTYTRSHARKHNNKLPFRVRPRDFDKQPQVGTR